MAGQFLGNFNDGEMYSYQVIPSPSQRPYLSHDHQTFSQRFPAFPPPLRTNPPNLELIRPVVMKGTSTGYFSPRGINPYTGGGFDPVQIQSCRPPPPNPVQAQVQSPNQRWFLRSRVVENQIAGVVGEGLRGNGRAYGGTGVYLPDYTAVTITTTTAASAAIATGPRRRNGLPAKHVNQARVTRCSPKKALESEEEHGHFQLPQEWTY